MEGRAGGDGGRMKGESSATVLERGGAGLFFEEVRLAGVEGAEGSE